MVSDGRMGHFNIEFAQLVLAPLILQPLQAQTLILSLILLLFIYPLFPLHLKSLLHLNLLLPLHKTQRI
jgi:hypothetical protein